GRSGQLLRGNLQRHAGPSSCSSTQTDRGFGRDSSRWDSFGAFAAGRATNQRPMNRAGDQESECPGLVRHFIFESAVDRARREHELVADKNDPARYLSRMRIELVGRAASEIDDFGAQAA